MRGSIAVVLTFLAVIAGAIPQFAREYKMACADCHTQPPKLNLKGQLFADSNYSPPRTKIRDVLPISFWLSAMAQTVPNDPKTVRGVANRIELISAGQSNRWSYFVEWRALSKEVLSSGSKRDRSGRFEDLFFTYDVNKSTQLQFGQYRALSQLDVSLRLNLGEPTSFSASLPGTSGSNSRKTSLRGFSLSGRSPSIRAMHQFAGTWNAALTIPFPGEFSIPLTSEARSTASFEFEPNPKGAFLELYEARGLQSVGVHAFVGNNERFLIGTAAQYNCGDLFFDGGFSHATTQGASEWRLSAGIDWIPSFSTAFGARLDYRDAPGFRPMISPYTSFVLPFGDSAVKLILEGRFQERRYPQFLLEVGWMF